MRHFAAAAVIGLVLSAITVSPLFAETVTQDVTPNNPLVVPFTLTEAGTFEVTALWEPNGKPFGIQIVSQVEPYPYCEFEGVVGNLDYYCYNAPAGDYVAIFSVGSGKLEDVTLITP